MDAQPIALLEPAHRKFVRHAARAGVELAEGERRDRAIAGRVLQSDAVGPAAKREGEKFSEVHRSQIAARRRVVQRVRAAPLIVIPSEGAQRLRLLSSRAKA